MDHDITKASGNVLVKAAYSISNLWMTYVREPPEVYDTPAFLNSRGAVVKSTKFTRECDVEIKKFDKETENLSESKPVGKRQAFLMVALIGGLIASVAAGTTAYEAHKIQNQKLLDLE